VPTISHRLHYGQSQAPVLEIIPDPAGLYRIAWPDIGLSDVANLTRCKQAAREWAQHQRMAKDRNLPVARRVKSLKNFSWSASYSDLNRSAISKAAWDETYFPDVVFSTVDNGEENCIWLNFKGQRRDDPRLPWAV